MVQQGPDNERGMMDASRAMASSGVRHGKVNALIPLGDGFAEDGGSNLYGVYWCELMVCYTSCAPYSPMVVLVIHSVV
jgi:hypothetical protein